MTMERKLSPRATEVLLSEVEILGGPKHVNVLQLGDIARRDPELQKLSLAELADIVIVLTKR